MSRAWCPLEKEGACAVSLNLSVGSYKYFFIILFIGASNAISLSSRCPLWKKIFMVYLMRNKEFA